MTRLLTTITVLTACVALTACGSSDDPADTVSTPVPTMTQAPSEAGTATATADATADGEDPEKTATPGSTPDDDGPRKGLPSTTPEPGPPVQFRVNITASALQPNVAEIPENRSLKVFLYNRSDKTTPFNLLANGNVVGAGVIEGGDKIFVLVRNLLPGDLVIKAGKRKSTVKVVAK